MCKYVSLTNQTFVESAEELLKLENYFQDLYQIKFKNSTVKTNNYASKVQQNVNCVITKNNNILTLSDSYSGNLSDDLDAELGLC